MPVEDVELVVAHSVDQTFQDFNGEVVPRRVQKYS